MVRVSNPKGEIDLLVSTNHPDRHWGPPSLLFSVYRGPFRGWSGQIVKLATHPCLVSKLRMNGVIPLFSLHAYMAWAGKTLPLTSPSLETERVSGYRRLALRYFSHSTHYSSQHTMFVHVLPTNLVVTWRFNCACEFHRTNKQLYVTLIWGTNVKCVRRLQRDTDNFGGPEVIHHWAVLFSIVFDFSVFCVGG